MRVLIVESCRADDFYSQELDGPATFQLLKLLGHTPELRFALDRKHLKLAIAEATNRRYKVLHLSSHGDTTGIQLNDMTNVSWASLASYFQGGRFCPDALVMSACEGASSGISDAFAVCEARPKIIVGSTASLGYDDYAVAWAILYRQFGISDVKRNAAKMALRGICAVVDPSFMYRRWDDDKEKYLNYPVSGVRYEVGEVEDEGVVIPRRRGSGPNQQA